jgi:outer membrane protein assembly factor BamB
MTETTSQPQSKKRPRGSLLLSVVWWVGVVMAAIGFAAMFPEELFGDSAIPVAVRQAALLLAALCAVVWFVFGSRVIKGVVAQLLTLTIVAALPFILIEKIEYSGDMIMLVHWRGSKSQEERLKEFAARANAAPDREDPSVRPVIGPFDMPSFNGPEYDGRVPGPTLLTSWASNAPVKLWERPVGAGYAGVAIVDDRIITLEQRDDEDRQIFEEWVVCYDLKSGSELWHYAYPAAFDEVMGGRGPRSTPLITEDGKVYTMGALGDVCCLNLADGSLAWHVELFDKQLLARNDKLIVQWGMSSSPLAWQDRIVVNKGGPDGKGLIALNRDDGEIVWSGDGVVDDASVNTRNRAGYSTPMLATIDGIELIVHLDGEGLRGYVPDTGEIVWSYAFENDAGVNVAQPIVFPDGRVFITCAYGVGSRMLKVNHDGEAWQVSELWESLRMRCKFSSPVLIDGYIYGLDQGVLGCISAETGDRQWRDGRYGFGQMLLRGEHLVVFTETGEIALVRPNPEEFEELALLPVFDRGKNWNPPGLARDILVVRNHYDMAAFKLPVEAGDEVTQR